MLKKNKSNYIIIIIGLIVSNLQFNVSESIKQSLLNYLGILIQI